jgi:endonuclease YncB( thermonuclease family)
MRVFGAPGETNAKSVDGRRFDNIRVLPDGKIRSKDVTIGLYGIVLPARDKLCGTPAGGRWACGVSAIGALRNMIQTRMIICSIDDDSEENKDKVVGSCRLGSTDIALRMLEQGWATPERTVREKYYLEAAEFGRNNGLGLWASGPSGAR